MSSGIKVELKPRALIGYILLAIGLITIFYTIFQAMATYNDVNDVFSGISDIVEEHEEQTIDETTSALEDIEFHVFNEIMFWFLGLILILMSGALISSIGLGLVKS